MEYMSLGVNRFSVGVQVGLTAAARFKGSFYTCRASEKERLGECQVDRAVCHALLVICSIAAFCLHTAHSFGDMPSDWRELAIEQRRTEIYEHVVMVQAFQQGLLEACGRSHSAQDVTHALTAITNAAPQRFCTCRLKFYSLHLQITACSAS